MIIFVILSFSLSMGLFWLLKEPLTSVLEWAAVRMVSSFSGRSAAVQQFIYIVIVAASGCVLYFLLKKLSRADRKISETFVIVFLAAVLAMLFVLCFEQTLRRDDYWETHDAQKYGFPGFLLLEFKSVNGRYFSLLLRSMYAFFDPELYIHAALAVNIGCLFAACIYLCRTLLFLSGHKVTMSRSLTGGTLLALSALFMSPKIWEVWFWGSGTFVYGVGITLAIAILALYLDACRGNTHIPLTIFCITCACGASELITASVCSFGVGLLLINWITGNKKRNKPLLFFTLWSFLCTGFVLVFSASAGYAGELSGGDAAGPGGFFGSLLLKLPGLLYESAGMLADYFYSRLEYAVYLMIAAFLFGIAFPKKKLNAVPILLGIV